MRALHQPFIHGLHYLVVVGSNCLLQHIPAAPILHLRLRPILEQNVDGSNIAGERCQVKRTVAVQVGLVYSACIGLVPAQLQQRSQAFQVVKVDCSVQ